MATSHLAALTISAPTVGKVPPFEGLRPAKTVKFATFGSLSQRSLRGLVVKASTVVGPKYTSIKPSEYNVVVKFKIVEEKSDGNPFIHISAQTKPQRGEVVAVGEGNTSEMIKIGAQVVFSKNVGIETDFNGSSHLILWVYDIIGILETEDIKDLKPLNDRVLIKVAETEEKTPAGLLLTSAPREHSSVGTVIAVAPDPLGEQGNGKPQSISPGDMVLFSKYAKDVFKDSNGSNYVALRVYDVMAILT